MYSKLKSGLPAEQIQLADMIPGMFLEACANDSEHIAARCWMRCSNQSNQPPLSRGYNEALSSRRLVSVGKMKHVSGSNEAKIKKNNFKHYSYPAHLLGVFSSRCRKYLILALNCLFFLFFFNLVEVLISVAVMSVHPSVCLIADDVIHHKFIRQFFQVFLQGQSKQ